MPHPEGYLLRAFRHTPRKARSGIYAGKQVDVGTRVSRDYEVKSRKWVFPNVQKVLLYSQGLGRKIRLPVTTAALKAIDRAGGLDRYLLSTPDSLLHSDKASDLKFKLSCIYWHKQHEEQQQQQRQRQQGQKHKQLEPPTQQQQQQQLHAGRLPLAAVQAARQQQAALATGGTSIGASRSWSSQAGSLLPPTAAAAAAATGARD